MHSRRNLIAYYTVYVDREKNLAYCCMLIVATLVADLTLPCINQKNMFSSIICRRAPLLALGSIPVVASSVEISDCSGEDHIPSLDYGWSHHGALASYDYKSIRRGFQVLKIRLPLIWLLFFIFSPHF